MCLTRAECLRAKHSARGTPRRSFSWTSAVDLGCWGFVMRQTCGYREQHAGCLPARPKLRSITNSGPETRDLLAPTGHAVKVTWASKHRTPAAVDSARARYNSPG
jgi:hypothetical protein